MNRSSLFLVGWVLALATAGCGGDNGATSSQQPDGTDEPDAEVADLQSDPADLSPDRADVLDEGHDLGEPGDEDPDLVEVLDIADLEEEEPGQPPPSGWHTEGQRILDPQGRQRILHGFNLSNDVKHPPYDSWAQEADYQRLQELGISALRLLTTWAAIMPEPGVIDETYLAKYDQRIEWAGRYNILVIMDMHQDVFGEGFGFNGAPRWACDESLYEAFEPRQPWYDNYQSPQVQECYGRFWSDTELQDYFIQAVVTLAERYRDKEQVIGIDLFNEPYWGPGATVLGFVRGQLQPFYERVLTALSQVDRSYLYLFEPPTVVQWGLSPGFEPFDFENLVYAPHFYHPTIELEYEYDGDPAIMELGLESYQQTAEELGVPWILGEWGGFTVSTNYDQYMRDMLAILESLQAGDLYWDYQMDDGGYCLLASDGTEKPLLVDIFARVYPKAVGGALIGHHFDDRTGEFTIELETVPEVTAETVLFFPETRHYPDGFTVESTDDDGTWSYQVDAERTELSFTIDRTETRHTLTIRPLPGG